MPAGRPLKFTTVEKLATACDAYFESCWEERTETVNAEIVKGEYKEAKSIKKRVQVRPYTITGLALFLDTTRDVLLDYENLEERKEYSNTIKRAKLRCQNYAEEYLYYGKNPAGAMFNLKANYKWEDKQHIETSGTVIIDAKDMKRSKPNG